VIDAGELLDVARLLVAGGDGVVTDGRIRRSISAAYYALFHTIVRAGAERFFGAVDPVKPGYAVLYRAFSHNRMKTLCSSVDRSPLPRNLQRQLGRSSIHSDIRDFAGTFIVLQEARHLADYDPLAHLVVQDALDLIDQTQLAIDAVQRAPSDQLADFLALMLVQARD
jgi:hypothetical protein